MRVAGTPSVNLRSLKCTGCIHEPCMGIRLQNGAQEGSQLAQLPHLHDVCSAMLSILGDSGVDTMYQHEYTASDEQARPSSAKAMRSSADHMGM